MHAGRRVQRVRGQKPAGQTGRVRDRSGHLRTANAGSRTLSRNEAFDLVVALMAFVLFAENSA